MIPTSILCHIDSKTSVASRDIAYRQVIAWQFLFAVFLALCCTALNATTLIGMDIDQLAADAEFIFEGEVIHTQTRKESGTGIINTYVTFSVVDVVKGDYNADSVELKFMGGVFNNQVVEVSGLTIPELGEQGIYFVESLNRDLINPLLGWSQGHFIIKDDRGERRISTLDDRPVTDIQGVSNIPLVIKKPQALIEGTGDVAAGVMTESNPIMIERALSVDVFKSRLRTLIDN